MSYLESMMSTMNTGEDISTCDALALLAEEACDLCQEILTIAFEEEANPGGHPAEVLLQRSLRLGVVARRVLICAVHHERDVGIRWKVIGAILGISRQAACTRFSSTSREGLSRWVNTNS